MTPMVAPQRLTFQVSLRRLDAAQKPGDGVPAYTRWVNRRAARYFCAAFAHLGATPSMVSVVSILTTLAGLGAFLALHRTPWLAGLVAAVLLAIGYALDSADGQLARLQGSSSLQGEWLDHTLDAVRMPTVHLSIAAGFLLMDAPLLAVVAAAFSVIASAAFLSQNLGGLLRDRSHTSRSRVRRHQSWLLLPADPGVLCWIFVLWAVLPFFGAAYVALFIANALHITVSTRRRWLELSEGASA
ncbi:CDP-alcohol phosphatidyltransferase family protein [Brachybacterium sp. UNK5269]|uniref:CDP-alcohol phosphatidyltransferase family protein n=1 Tax=Brachybacterium sp. UNK5269 TaxID=3408576 RepID=UPI003BAE6B5A